MSTINDLMRIAVRVARLEELARLASDMDRVFIRRIRTAADGDGEDEAKPSGGSKKPGGKFIQFMKEEGDTKVRNPDTGNQVKLKSLNGPKGKKVVQKAFQKWLAEQDKKDKAKNKPAPKQEEQTQQQAAPAKSKFPKPELKKDRYKHNNFRTYRSLSLNGKPPPSEGGAKVIKAFSSSGELTSDQISDMMGLPAISGKKPGYNVIVYDEDERGLSVEISGPHIRRMSRRLKIDEDGKPYIYNDTIALDGDAPPGMGTRIFATQVSQAHAAGISKIKCEAFRSESEPSWVGYKVWPRLGYDGQASFLTSVPDDLQKKMKDKGFKKPWKVSHFLQVEGGREWWDENGNSFEAEFDLAEDSLSMQVLGAYLAAKAEKEGKQPEEWMVRTSSAVTAAKKDDKDQDEDKADKKDKGDKKPKPKGKNDREHLDLDDEDNELLDNIWKKLRK
jgi:hypothetical protein